jgi:hypothetical protein
MKSNPIMPADAQPVSRRHLLRGAAMVTAAATVFVAAEPAAAGSMTQKAAGYQTTPKGDQKCDGCALFVAPSSCKLVAGDISPSGWCRLYAKKS